jgi:hypothetical protein
VTGAPAPIRNHASRATPTRCSPRTRLEGTARSWADSCFRPGRRASLCLHRRMPAARPLRAPPSGWLACSLRHPKRQPGFDNPGMTDAVRDLAQGRASYADRAWRRAYEALRAADQANELGPEDLERLATSAYVLGREDEYLALLERAHGAHLEADDPRRAVRCAFWIGAHFAQRGEMAQACGMARAGEAAPPASRFDRARAWLPAVAIGVRARGSRRVRRRGEDRGRSGGHRPALRRPGPVRARRSHAGPPPDRIRPTQSGLGVARRGDGAGRRRRTPGRFSTSAAAPRPPRETSRS